MKRRALIAALAALSASAFAAPAAYAQRDPEDGRSWRGGSSENEGRGARSEGRQPDDNGREREWRRPDARDDQAPPPPQQPRWQPPPQPQPDPGVLDGGPGWRPGGDDQPNRPRDWNGRPGGDDHPNRPRDWNGRDRDHDWGRDDRGHGGRDRYSGNNDWGRDWNGHHRGNDWRRWDWDRNNHHYDRWRHTHRDFYRPRYDDWRHVRHGYYFDDGYRSIVRLFFGWDYYWWSYPNWRRPYRPWRVGYYLPDYIWWEPVPYDLYWRLPPAPYGCRYIMVDRDILLISVSDGRILDALLYNDRYARDRYY